MKQQEEQFMPEADPIDRLRVMNDNFDRINETYTKILTEPELTDMRAELDKLVIDIDSKEDDLTAYVKPRKDEIKTLKVSRRRLSETTKYGQQEVTNELFIMKDFHQGMAYLRDDNGMLVKVRPLTSEEKQGNMFG